MQVTYRFHLPAALLSATHLTVEAVVVDGRLDTDRTTLNGITIPLQSVHTVDPTVKPTHSVECQLELHGICNC